MSQYPTDDPALQRRRQRRIEDEPSIEEHDPSGLDFPRRNESQAAEVYVRGDYGIVSGHLYDIDVSKVGGDKHLVCYVRKDEGAPGFREGDYTWVDCEDVYYR